MTDESSWVEAPAEEEPGRETDTRKRSVIGQVVELVVMLVLAFALAQLVRTYVVQPFVVPTGSMLPTIQLGDHLLANKFVYLFEKPGYGDVVVLDDPTGETPMLIKRVIAVGGQTVDIHDDRVWVDGRPLIEPYTHGTPTELGTVPMPIKLPPGTVWVMGDNRTSSKDSRFIGPQPVTGVHGKAFVVYWPIGRLGSTFGI